MYFILRTLQRSGTHAISEWLLQDHNAKFFNNIDPPFARWKSLNSSEITSVNNKQMEKILRNNQDNKKIIFGLEDQNIWHKLHPDYELDQINILLIRSPINYFCSLIKFRKHLQNHPRTLYYAVQNWKSYAYEFIGKTNFHSNKINILFDSWNLDASYRQRLYKTFEEFDFSFDPLNKDYISDAGGGSSFTGTTVKGRELTKAVSNRINDLEPNLQMIVKSIMKDEEINSLYEQIKKSVY